MLLLAFTLLSESAGVELRLSQANAHQAAGSFAVAETIYRQVLERAAHLGSNNRPRAVGLNNLAALLYRRGRYSEANERYLEAADVWRSLGSDADLTATLANLAELANAMGRQAVALRYSQEAIRQAGLLGDRRSNALAIHANILRGMGRIAESRQFLKLASEAAPDATRGHSLTTLAQLELAEGNFDAARAACLESCRLWESTNGHPSYLGNALAILSRIEAAVGDSSASERLARRALAIFEESLGQNHPRVVTALADLAECVKERRPDEAGRLLERAMRIAREKLGENHQEAIALALALADIERRTGRPEEAWKLYDWSLRGARTAFGPSSSRIAPYLNNAAIALMDLARYSEAEQLFREALQVREAELGPMHVSSAETLYNLGVVLARRLEMGEARKFVERSLAVRQMHYGEDHPSMLPGLELYGRLLLGAGEKRRARSVRHRMETLAASDPEMRHKVDVKALQSAFR